MSTHRHIDFICIAVFVCALVLTVLFMNGERLGIEKLVDEDAERNAGSAYFTSNDLSADYDRSGATVITLTSDGASISGSGAYVNGSDVVITNAGVYSLSGTLTDGSIVVDAYRSSKVFLYFDGVSVTASDDAALRVDQADKVFVTLAPGSENSLTSGEVYSDAALADGTDGAIFARDDLTINGSGSLSVTAAYRHGIAANDELVITGGRVTVSAPADGIHANDALRITNCALTVTAGDDGLVADNEETALFYLESGFVTVTAADDAVHSNGDIEIVGGDLSISAGDDGIHAEGAVTISGGTILISECYEGIEGVTIDVSGGDITIYPSDDGFNAGGGSASGFGFPGGFGGMMGGPGGFGGRGGRDQSAGTGESAGSTESGTGAGTVTAAGETTAEPGGTASASGAAQQERPTGTAPTIPTDTAAFGSSSETDSESEEPCIRISGGTITILNASGRDADGLDSNGSIYITGGDIRVSLTGSGGNNAIDYGSESGGVCVISGGTVIACGSSSMTEAFDESSEQPAILWNFSTVTEDGSSFTLTDESGETILSWDVPYGFNSVNVSAPALQLSETYTLSAGSESETVTLESSSTTAGSASGFGGMGGFGGGMMGGGFGGRGERTGESGTDGGNEVSGEAGGFPGGGFGRHGGFPGQGSSTDGTDGSTEGGFPQPPDFENGEMPTPPDFAAGGMPDFNSGEMPAPPDTEGGSGSEDAGEEAPAADSSADESGSEAAAGQQGFGGRGMREGRSGMDRQPGAAAAAEDAEEETVALSHGSALSELDSATWPMLALCAVVLLAGLAVAVAYRRRR